MFALKGLKSVIQYYEVLTVNYQDSSVIIIHDQHNHVNYTEEIGDQGKRTKQDHVHKTSNLGLILGLIIGFIALILMLIGILYYAKKQYQKEISFNFREMVQKTKESFSNRKGTKPSEASKARESGYEPCSIEDTIDNEKRSSIDKDQENISIIETISNEHDVPHAKVDYKQTPK